MRLLPRCASLFALLCACACAQPPVAPRQEGARRVHDGLELRAELAREGRATTLTVSVRNPGEEEIAIPLRDAYLPLACQVGELESVNGGDGERQIRGSLSLAGCHALVLRPGEALTRVHRLAAFRRRGGGWLVALDADSHGLGRLFACDDDMLRLRVRFGCRPTDELAAVTRWERVRADGSLPPLVFTASPPPLLARLWRGPATLELAVPLHPYHPDPVERTRLEWPW